MKEQYVRIHKIGEETQIVLLSAIHCDSVYDITFFLNLNMSINDSFGFKTPTCFHNRGLKTSIRQIQHSCLLLLLNFCQNGEMRSDI